MHFRISTASNYNRLLRGIQLNQNQVLTSQEQVATGRRILRPSDDPIGTARSLSISRRIANVERYSTASQAGQLLLDHGASTLEGASRLMTDARELILKGMNGTLSQPDRNAIAGELEVLREEMLDIANTRNGERYLFGGTKTANPPWIEELGSGSPRVVYQGNDDEQLVQVSADLQIAINLAGSTVFGSTERTGTEFSGLTGVSGGTTANEGSGYAYLQLRHDSTDPGLLATSGVALVNGGADDTLLGTSSLTIDPVAGTVKLGAGPALKIPDLASSDAADVRVLNESGGEVHLDFSGWTGAAYAGDVTGNGSASLDGTTFTALSFTETDLELKDPETGTVLHVDTTGVTRSGTELVSFADANNVFDMLQGAVEDLRNGDDLKQDELIQRLNIRLSELDKNQTTIGGSLSLLGSRSARMQGADMRLQGLDLQLNGLLSETRDVDLAEAVSDMVRAEQGLQVAQASGVRLIQSSLLNFLR